MTQLRPEGFRVHLEQGLASVYLLAGDEPLLVEEALDELRAAARAAGFSEREVLHVEAGFDWARLREASDTLSLFGDRRLLELRLPTGKPGTEGARVLQEYARRPPADTVLVVVAGKLEGKQRQSGWAKALAGAGGMLYLWPIRATELSRWLRGRLRAHGLSVDADALALLAARAEGNLLAAAQEIEKLALIHGGGELNAAAIREAVTDSARFGVFDLPEAVLAGDVARAVRILEVLRQEGEEPFAILGILARDLRIMIALGEASAKRGRADAVFDRMRVWRGQRARYQQALRRAPPQAWIRLMPRAARVDRVVKGATKGRAWEELLQLASGMALLAGGHDERLPSG